MSMLERFRHEVMERGADACLPKNLSDEWIRIIASGADLVTLELGHGASSGSEADERKAIAVAGVATLLWAKSSGAPVQVTLSQLTDYVRLYRLELALEILHRSAELRYDPASLASILTDRDIAASWNDDPHDGSKRFQASDEQAAACRIDGWVRVRPPADE